MRQIPDMRGLLAVGMATLVVGCGGEATTMGWTDLQGPATPLAPGPGAMQADADHPVAGADRSSGEASVVADPRRPGAAVVAFLEFASQNPHIGVRRTTDGGRTWRETAQFASLHGDLWTADPSLAFAPDGTLYLAYLQGASHDPPHGGGLYVARSGDGGATWSAPALAVPSMDQGVCSGPDKVMIAAGPGGRVHVSYQDHTDSPEAGCDGDGPTVVRVASSRDGGRSFDSPVALSTDADNAFGSMPRVLANGTLLVSHLAFDGLGLTQKVARSTDGGRTFERIHVADVATPAAAAGGAPLAANAIPTLSTDRDGRVAMAWVANEGPTGEDNLVEVHVSEEAGRSWKALPPVAIGLPIALQQWLAHGPDGRLHLFFYGAMPSGLYDAYLTSFDGRAWSEPLKLSSRPSSGAVGYGFGIGHYPGLDVGPDGMAYPMWSDARDRPAMYSFYLWTRSVHVGGTAPVPAPAGEPSPPAPGPAAAEPAPGPAARVEVRRTRRGFVVRVRVAGRHSLRAELLRRGRRVAAARRGLGSGTRPLRLRAPGGGRYVLRVTVIDGTGRRTVVQRRLRR